MPLHLSKTSLTCNHYLRSLKGLQTSWIFIPGSKSLLCPALTNIPPLVVTGIDELQ